MSKRILLHDYGGHPFSLQLARSLARKGLGVWYLHSGKMQALQRANYANEHPNLVVDHVEISQNFAKYSMVKRWFQEREYGKALVQKTAAIQAEIVISSTSPLDVQAALLGQAKHRQQKFIFWWQDITGLAIREILSKKNYLLGQLAGNYYIQLEKHLLHQSDAVIAIADEFRPIYQQWGLDEKKLSILPNWAPLDALPCLPKETEWSRKHRLHDKFVFLFSGTLALKQNPDVFIHLARHFEHQPQVAIVVISEGPGANWLQTEKETKRLTNLQILPFQSSLEHPYALSSADVLITSLENHAGSYSVPSKTLSYLCAGRPILVSAPLNNQSTRIVLENQAGVAATPGNATDLCAQAQQLFDSADLRKKMGVNARQYAEKTFNIDKITESFLNCLP